MALSLMCDIQRILILQYGAESTFFMQHRNAFEVAMEGRGIDKLLFIASNDDNNDFGIGLHILDC